MNPQTWEAKEAAQSFVAAQEAYQVVFEAGLVPFADPLCPPWIEAVVGLQTYVDAYVVEVDLVLNDKINTNFKNNFK